jgi:hypothetical protein
MNHQCEPELSDDEPIFAFYDVIAALIGLFVPDVEDDEWAWWPGGYDFYQEWDAGDLMTLALEAAVSAMDRDRLYEPLTRAFAIAQEGLSFLETCEEEATSLPFRLLLGSLAGQVVEDLEEAASVLAGCFDLGEMLSQDRLPHRAEIIATELYEASSDWAFLLTGGLVGLKLRLLGPDFDTAMQSWYDQLLEQAKAHYLSSELPRE